MARRRSAPEAPAVDALDCWGATPHDTSYPARVWAGLLDLPDPEGNGARRVTAALTWLEQHNFVRINRDPGLPATVYLNDERGTGSPYVHPAKALLKVIDEDNATSRDDYYVKLPAAFWTRGWISILNGPALTTLLSLMVEAAKTNRESGLWFSPRIALDRFSLSSDTRSVGFAQLAELGVIDVRRRSVSRTSFDYKKMRNTYTLHLDRLLMDPASPTTTDSKSAFKFKPDPSSDLP